MAMDAGEIEKLIRAGIPDAEVTIRDLAGDGDHYAATVIAASFRGKSRVQQHQLVYQALKGEMGGKLHALALQTGTPEGVGGVKTEYPCRSAGSGIGGIHAQTLVVVAAISVLCHGVRRTPSRSRPTA